MTSYPTTVPATNTQVMYQDVQGHQGLGMANPSLPSGRQDVIVVVPVLVQESVNGLPTRCVGRQPQQFYCVTCQKAQVSSTHHKLGLGSLTWAACCIVFCLPCLFCLPLCCPGCQEVEHRCPQCRREVGKNRFIFGDGI